MRGALGKRVVRQQQEDSSSERESFHEDGQGYPVAAA